MLLTEMCSLWAIRISPATHDIISSSAVYEIFHSILCHLTISQPATNIYPKLKNYRPFVLKLKNIHCAFLFVASGCAVTGFQYCILYASTWNGMLLINPHASGDYG